MVWRGRASLALATAAVLVLGACASSSGGRTPAEEGGQSAMVAAGAPPSAAPKAKKVRVEKADGKVDQEEIHLSESAGESVEWQVDAGTLEIVPADEKTFPVTVTCKGSSCSGTLRTDIQHEYGKKHKYRTRVDGKLGPDPFIIIGG
jgi:hypothetical protein